jgi:trk system potassium uptake protein TrkA
MLAAALTRSGHHVSIIDRDQGAFEKANQRLGHDFASETFVGIGIDEEVLQRAGIENAGAFISVTSGDNTNIVAAQIARYRFHVPKTLARVYDPIRAEAYREAGIDTVCSTQVISGILYDLLLDQPLRNCREYLEAAAEASPEATKPEG